MTDGVVPVNLKKRLPQTLFMGFILALIHSAVYLSAFFLKLILHGGIAGAAIYYVLLLALDVFTFAVASRLFKLNERRNLFRGLVFLFYTVFNIVSLLFLMFVFFAHYDPSETTAELFAFGLLAVPPLIAAVSFLTQKLTYNDMNDESRYTLFPLPEKCKKHLIITVSVVLVLFVASSATLTALVMPLREYDGEKITSVAKGFDRIYIVTESGKAYINGTARTTADKCAYGFDDANYYRYRGLFGKTEAIFLRDNVKKVFVFSLGGMFLCDDGSLYYFHGETDDCYSPVKIADNVVFADAKGDLAYWTDENGNMYAFRVNSGNAPQKIAEKIVFLEFNTYYITYLTDKGELFMKLPSPLASGESDPYEEPFLTGVSSYSSKYGLNNLLYISVGDAFYADWFDINGKPRINVDRPASDDAISVACGGHYSVIVKQNGTAELYTGEMYAFTYSEAPVIAAVPDTTSIALLTEDGKLIPFGSNERGQSGKLK